MSWFRRLAGLAAMGIAGCNGQILEVGSHGAWSLPPDSSGAGAVPPAAASCTFSAAYSDGSGYRSGEPSSCSAADGPQHAFASVSEVRSALAGSWYQCTGTIGNGIEFANDGHYAHLQADILGNLVAVSAAAGSGTFEVLDASATLGPGTYQVRLTQGNGGVSVNQVVVYDSPTKVRLFAPSATDYVPALTWKFRAGLCGPAFGPYHTFSDVADVTNRAAGRWIWCSGPPIDSVSASVGVEFTAGGMQNLVYDDESGSVVADSTASYTVILSLPGNGGPSWAGLQSYPPRPNVTSTPSMFSIDECGRGLRWFAQGLPGLSPGTTQERELPPGWSSGDVQEYQRLPQ